LNLGELLRAILCENGSGGGSNRDGGEVKVNFEINECWNISYK
jgi:hypothetical protein